MKIGISTFGGDGGKSGISRYIISLLENMDRIAAGHEYDVHVFFNEKDIFLPGGSTTMRAVEQSETLRSPVRSIAWHQLSFPRIARREGYDLVFLPAANRRSCLSLPCPSVGTFHDLSSIHVKGKYDPARNFYIRKVLPLFARRLTHVLTVSENSKRDIVDFARVPPERVTVTPLAADHDTYYQGDKDAATEIIRSNYPIHAPYILYTSRLEHPGKNHVRLIEAFDLLKQREDLPHLLVLAGSNWSGSEAVHEAAARARHSRDIIFPGFVASAHLPDLYRAADVFIFPSLYEGFGLPILEAMACGVPTTCSNISSMPEVAGDAAPTFDPGNIEEIADVLRRLLCDASFRETTRANGIHRAATFNWERTARMTLDVFAKVADQS